MKAKKIVVWILCVLTVAAVVSGLVFFFAGNRKIDEKPENVQVSPYEDDFMLWTTYNPQYSYTFRVEKQKGNGEFVVLETKTSSKNNIKLSEFSNVIFVAGENYRFSACYSLNNKNGQFCDPYVWVAI